MMSKMVSGARNVSDLIAYARSLGMLCETTPTGISTTYTVGPDVLVNTAYAVVYIYMNYMSKYKTLFKLL